MITLAQAKLNTQDAIQAGVIDEFRKSSFILDTANIPLVAKCFVVNAVTFLKGGIGIAPMHQRKLYGSVKPT